MVGSDSRRQKRPQSNAVDPSGLGGGEQQTETWPVLSLNSYPTAALLPQQDNPYTALILERQILILGQK